jgi:hypothetical protein
VLSLSIKWENRAHFFGIAARLMRIVLVDYARARRATKRGGGLRPVLVEVSEALDKLAKVGARKATVIELRYFGGMSCEEVVHASDVACRLRGSDRVHGIGGTGFGQNRAEHRRPRDSSCG